ncbi:MAG: DNA polymerase III subunit delta, partial [Aeromicrobium erythreum]
ASGLRSLARMADAPGLSDGELARHVGVPPFKLRILRGQLRSWTPQGLSRALSAVARADLDVKSGEADGDFAVERMVLQVAAARGR